MARCVWALTDVDVFEHAQACQCPDARSWLFTVMDSLSHEDFVKLLVTIWAIWIARRKAFHEAIFQSPLSTFGFITSYLHDLKLAKGKEVHPTTAKVRTSS